MGQAQAPELEPVQGLEPGPGQGPELGLDCRRMLLN